MDIFLYYYNYMEVFYNYIKLLNDDKKKSIRYYTTHEYKELNKNLRKGNVINSGHQKHYNNIMDIFDGGPTVMNSITLYRGMTKTYTVSKNEGFLSTSTSKNIAKTFAGRSCCLYIITLTPGEYTILPIESLSEMPEECEVLLPPGKLSIQKIIPYTDKTNVENIDIIYCTFIPENANIIQTKDLIQQNIIINKIFQENSIQLTIQSWVDRILDSGIVDEINIFCESEINCILEQLQTLEFYNNIPQEAIDKFIKLYLNINNQLNL